MRSDVTVCWGWTRFIVHHVNVFGYNGFDRLDPSPSSNVCIVWQPSLFTPRGSWHWDSEKRIGDHHLQHHYITNLPPSIRDITIPPTYSQPFTASKNPNSKTQILDHYHSLASPPRAAGEVQPQVWACLCCRDQQVGSLFTTFSNMIVSLSL